MGDEGLSGAVRRRSHRTTIPAKDGVRAGDFTYCRTLPGFVHVAFITDVFSRYIVGWYVMTSRLVELVTARAVLLDDQVARAVWV